MQKTKVNKFLHKWLSLIVGIQLMLWLATGLYFNLMDFKKASGNAHRLYFEHKGNLADFNLTPLSTLQADKAIEVKIVWLLSKPYYQLIFKQGQHSYQKSESRLYDATSGKEHIFEKQQIIDIAQGSYSGGGELTSVELAQPPFADYVQQQNPMWQVNVKDELNTTIYLDAVTGQIIRHANDDSRLKDLMFKLHFMDYQATGDFNNWLIIIFAIATLVFAITGVIWLVQLYQNGMLSITWLSKKKTISVTYAGNSEATELILSKDTTVLAGLAQSNISLPSGCGGGGICGQCSFISKKPLKVTPSDQVRLSKSQLDAGYRLSCQHKIAELTSIEVEFVAIGRESPIAT